MHEHPARTSEPVDPHPSSTGHAAPPARVAVLAAIACGGALGAPARYELGLAVHVASGTFPWGTFWINVSGSFLLGVIVTLVFERWPPTRYVRPFAAIGFLGAYTTFSTFAVETSLLVKDGHGGVAVAYVGASLAAGLMAVYVGVVTTRLGNPPERSTR